jgi:Leucine-rich repeat (LRR) protein
LLLIFSIIIDESEQATDCEWKEIQGTNQETYLTCSQTEQTLKSDWSFEIPKNFIWGGTHHLGFKKIRVTSFQSGIFKKLVNVKTIDLSENELNTIDFNEFANNKQLESLDVSKNKINEIKPIQTSTQINIISLMIQDNALTDISELCKLKKVKTFDLSRNRRLDYRKVTFNCWSELTYLNLTDTNLKQLKHDYRVLAGCNTLEYLNLSDNDLGILCFEHFPALSKLTNLIIRNNSLINLDVSELKNKCASLQNIVMDDNKLSCAYFRETLKKQLDESNIQVNYPWPCLEKIKNPEERSCPETKNQPTNPPNPTNQPTTPHVPKTEEIEGRNRGIFVIPILTLFALDCVLFIIVLVLLIVSRM